MLVTMNERLEAIVSGRVQGVMYRDFVERKARVLRLTGEVQNLPDGTVRVVAEGARKKLEELIDELHEGPMLAQTEHVAVSWLPATAEYTSFRITHV